MKHTIPVTFLAILIATVSAKKSIQISSPIRAKVTESSGKLSRFLEKDGKYINNVEKLSELSHTSAAASHSHGMSMTALIINLIADLCPHGMLPLAYGFAKGGPTGLVVAFALLIIFALSSAYTMISLAELSAATGAQNFGELWSRIINPNSRWIADASIFSLCFGCCVFYSAFIGDIFSALSSAVGISGLLSNRALLLGILSTVIIVPLCLTDDLSALKYSSFVGVAGIFYTVSFHIKRLLDGKYSTGSDFLLTMPEKLQPNWSGIKLPLYNFNKDTLVLVNMLCVGFLAHYNAITYYNELERTSTIRYKRAITIGFTITLAVFTSMMLVGYFLFGSAAQPLILNNFHRSKDVLATVARIAIGFAIICAYPLMFTGLKQSLFNLLPNNFSENVFLRKQTIVVVVAAITAIACNCAEEDVSVVLGIVGSLLGCGVAYIIPGILRVAFNKKQGRGGVRNSLDMSLNSLLSVFGTLFAILGVWITLSSTGGESHH